MERRTSDIKAAVLLSVLAAGLMMAPTEWGTAVRLTLRDVLAPGLAASRSVQEASDRLWNDLRQPHGADPRIAALEAEVQRWQAQCRQLQVANANLHEKIAVVERQGVLPWPVTATEPLVVPELVAAAVLAPETGRLWQTGPLVDKGRRNGLHGEELVLGAGPVGSGAQPLIDQGTAAGLADGQPVFAGRCVVGRLTDVGRVVSVVQPVTDPRFRGLARLVRRTSAGFSFGAEGILEGTGEDYCLLRHVPATEPVAVGDDVYTSGRDDPTGHPMYYGRVTLAELEADGQTWRIQVLPVVSKVRGDVTVFRQKLNPLRTAAN